MVYRPIACALGAALLMAFCAPCAKADDDVHVTVHPLYGAGTLTSQGIQGAQQDIQKIPGAANVVPASEYKQTYALSLRDVLEKTPGVFVQPRFGEDVRLSIRGSGLSRGFHLRGISLLQDGVPFNLSDGSGDFQEIDPLFLQHVEVYRGGNALRYGVATLGGAINMATPSGRTAPAGSLLRAEAGSYGTFRVHAETAGRSGNADGFAAMTKSLSGGYRQHTDTDNTRFNGNAGYRLSGDAETRFYLSLNDINQEIPGTLSRFDAIHNPTKAPPINIVNDYARDIRSMRI
ncbi:MAG TPA: TonB-dependent receptor plug domain-containing protein, partial [Micavibrio sp.]